MQTPYFIFKPKILEKNYLLFYSLCQKYFDNSIIAYSVKTNSFKDLIYKLSELGSGFEVASLKEINLVKDLESFKVFNGACKTKEELEIAIEKKFLINIDSKSEMEKINELIASKPFEIGIRISLSESKFGFDETQLDETINYTKSKNLNIISLHFHHGTQKSFSDYTNFIKKASEITSKIINQDIIKLKYINLGGGFPDKFQLKNLNKNLEDYFRTIKKYFGKFNLTIILEPGRCLVSDAFELITKVHVIKQKPNAIYAILDAGINLLPKITLSQFIFSKINKNKTYNREDTSKKPLGVLDKEYILAGPLLFNNDILGKFYGHLKEGDLVKVENVGAYCYALAWEISYDKPEIVET